LQGFKHQNKPENRDTGHRILDGKQRKRKLKLTSPYIAPGINKANICISYRKLS